MRPADGRGDEPEFTGGESAMSSPAARTHIALDETSDFGHPEPMG